MKILLTYLFSTLLLLGCRAQQQQPLPVNENDNSLLWRITGPGVEKPSYLFGTFHLLCKKDIHLSDALKTAMSRSDTVYMEMDMDDPSVMLSGMLYMNMKDGKTLEDLYTPEEYDRLKNYFQDSLKMPFTLFSKAKPFFLMALFYPRMMDCATPTGVETELVNLAKTYKKEIHGLETMKFQASIFDSIPYEWQAKELLKNVDSFAVNKAEFTKMLNLYKKQDLDSIGILALDENSDTKQFEDQLLGNRNRNWVHYLDGILKNQSVFVAVGAGHLPGKIGLINLLRKAGYTVEPLKN